MSAKTPDHYDDPLGLDEPEALPDAAGVPNAPVVAGLSEEDDAKRYLEQRFNNNLRTCTNCEMHYDPLQANGDEIRQCPRCGNYLALPDTPPTKRKHT